MDEEYTESLDSENTLYQMPAAGSLSDTDLLYLIQGLGTDRDRQLTLAVLLSWIAGKIQEGGPLASLIFTTAHDTYKNISFLNGDGLEIENASNVSGQALSEQLRALLKTGYLNIIKTANNEKRETVVDADGIRFRHGTGSGNEKGTILIDLTTNKIVISDASGVDIVGLFQASDGIECKKRGSFERLNQGSSKSFFQVSNNTDINTLIANSGIDSVKGDIVVLHNFGETSITVTLGTRQGSGGIETKTVSLNSECAMEFICNLRQVSQGTTYIQWTPLGNAVVQWNS